MASLSIIQIAQCHRSELVPTCLKWPHSRWLQDVFWELHPNRAAAGTGSSAGGRRRGLGGGGDWNETWAAKSPNLGPGFFGRQQSVKFYRISYVGCAAASVPVPWYCQTVALREDEDWIERVEERRCDASFCTKYYNADKMTQLVGDTDFSVDFIGDIWAG